MQVIQEMIEEFNTLRQQVYEAELRIQQFIDDEQMCIKQSKIQIDEQQTKIQKQNAKIQNDQLNKITLALTNSLTRVIKDLYYDEDKDLTIIKLQEHGIIIELEMKQNDLKRIKLQQVGRRDYTLLDQEHLNIEEMLLKFLEKPDQPFNKKEKLSTNFGSKEAISNIDQILKGNFIENKIIQKEQKKELNNQQINEKKQQDIKQLLYDFQIGDKIIEKSSNQKQVQEINEIPYVLDFIEKKEKQQFQLQTQMDETEMLKAFKKKMHTLEVFQEIEISNEQVEFYEKNKGMIITSITCFENIVAFGTSKAIIYIQCNNQIIQLEQNKKINLCSIICLSYFDKGKKLIAISQQQILLFIKNQFTKAFQINIEGKPVAMTMCNKGENFKFQFLMTDSLGNVYLVGVKQTFLNYEIQFKLLLKENNICYQIESLNFKDQEYIFLTFKDSIQIINLIPEYQLLIKLNYKVPQDKYIQTKCQIEKEILKIAVSYENTLEILSIQFDKKKQKKQNLNLLCSYNFNNEDIQYLIWLSNDIIFIKHERKRYSLISISEILQQKVELIQKQLSHDILSLKLGDKFQVFVNSICNSQNYLFFISTEQKQRIIHYKLKTWEDFIQQFQLNGQWKEQFGMGLYLYQGNLIKLGNLPRIERQEYLKPYLHIQIQKFVENSVKSQTSSSVYIAIEFLTMIESYEFLFNQIYLIYKNNRFEKEFYKSLESFIQQGVIKQIPTDSLKDLLQYLCQEHKISLLKLFIANLDKRYINSSLIKEYFIRCNLQTLSIYIPSKEIDNYKSPLKTIFEIYEQILNKNQQDLQYYFKSIEIDIQNLSNKQIDEEIQNLGYKCIWFLSLLFKGEQFSQERIPEDYWSQIVGDILQWILQNQILEKFLQIDVGIFLNEFLLIFKDDKKYRQLQKYENVLREDLEEELTFSEIILQKVEMTIKKLNMVNQFNSFILEIMKLGYKITYEHFLQVMIHNLRNPYENLQYFVKQSNFKYQKRDYQFIHDFTKQDKVKRDNFLIQYITFFRKRLLNDDATLQEILTEASQSKLSCSRIQSEIYCLKGEWFKCLDTMLSSTIKEDKDYIFNYIDRILNSNEFVNQIQEILEYLLAIIQKLADISVEKLKILLHHFSGDLYKQAIEKLDSHPNFKLHLLYEIIKEQRSKNQIIDNSIMISYFRLLCKHYPDDVYEELQYGDFPQEECMKICKEFNIMKGMAFLKERSGFLKEALEIYFDVISKDFDLIEIKESQIHLDEEIQILIIPCLKICRENYSNQYDNFELWLIFIQRMQKLRLEFFQQTPKYKSINKVFMEIIVEILDRVHPNLIINNLGKLLKNFTQIKELKIITQELQKLCFFQLITFEQYIGNIIYRNFGKLEELYNKGMRGTYLIARCLICQQENDQYMYGFLECNHIFHKQCLKMIKHVKVCKICLDQGNHCDKLKVQLEILVENNYEQQDDVELKQATVEEQQILSKQEKRMMQINKWKMRDIENEFNKVLY
ncbi:unnamed protein product [Paramecium sonneborni]|uniref:RING-type domain-containing protein n=1 Tax=Paramecium sonneborni TaxID=65129 RepID=A0A8S1MUE9_9CILI|nr:unnamed protein product [Paramecium sonneborni]